MVFFAFNRWLIANVSIHRTHYLLSLQSLNLHFWIFFDYILEFSLGLKLNIFDHLLTSINEKCSRVKRAVIALLLLSSKITFRVKPTFCRNTYLAHTSNDFGFIALFAIIESSHLVGRFHGWIIDGILRVWWTRHCDNTTNHFSWCALGCRQIGGGLCTASLTHHNDLLWIAAEKVNIFMHKTQRCGHIKKCSVARKLSCSIAEESKRAQTILNRNKNDILRCEGLGLIETESRLVYYLLPSESAKLYDEKLLYTD